MIVGDRSYEGINETGAFVSRTRAAILKVFKDWTASRKPGCDCASCGRQRQVNAQRLGTRKQELQMAADLNLGPSHLISECTVRLTLHCMGRLCCMQLRRGNVSNSHRNTRVGHSSIDKELGGPMNPDTPCSSQSENSEVTCIVQPFQLVKCISMEMQCCCNFRNGRDLTLLR